MSFWTEFSGFFFSFTPWREGFVSLFWGFFSVVIAHFILSVNDHLPYCFFLVFKIYWISCRRQVRKDFWLLMLQQENTKIKWLATGVLFFLLSKGCTWGLQFEFDWHEVMFILWQLWKCAAVHKETQIEICGLRIFCLILIFFPICSHTFGVSIFHSTDLFSLFSFAFLVLIIIYMNEINSCQSDNQRSYSLKKVSTVFKSDS